MKIVSVLLSIAWVLLLLIAAKLIVAILMAATAGAAETTTEWLARSVPTSQPLVRCANGRTPHIKFPVDTWKGCVDPPRASMWRLLTIDPMLDDGDTVSMWKLFTIDPIDPTLHDGDTATMWKLFVVDPTLRDGDTVTTASLPPYPQVLFDYRVLGPSPRTPRCRGHWRVPRVWCPGPR